MAIASGLTAIMDGKIHRMIIMMPPRHGKTLLSSVYFPAYVLGFLPATRIVLASYSAALAVLNSRRIRDLVANSVGYREVFPRVRLNEKKLSEREWETVEEGGVLAVGVGSGLTGRGADLVVIDDPVKDAEEANSSTIRESIFEWYSTVVRTRLQVGGAIVVIMTSWHEDDLVHRLLDLARNDSTAESWAVLRLPALAEEDDPLGRQVGEALWPEVFPRDDLLAIQAVMGRYFDALYQQSPRSQADRLFRREWFILAEVGEAEKWCRSWDLAVSVSESADWTVGAKVGVVDAGIDGEEARRLRGLGFDRPQKCIVADVVRLRAEFPDVRREIYRVARLDGFDVPIVIEKSRADLGMLQDLRRDLSAAGFRVVVLVPKGDKAERAGRLSVAAEAGLVTLLRADWNNFFLKEFDDFPQSQHDDQVDATSQGFNWLLRGDFRLEVV